MREPEQRRTLEAISADLARLVSEISVHPDFSNGKRKGTPFPPKQIRSLAALKKSWGFLEEKDRRSIACCIQLCDVFRWQLNFWDINFTAGNMFRLYAFVAVSSATEHLALQYSYKCGLKKAKKFFNDAIVYLHDKKIIDDALHKRLVDSKSERNKIHLERLGHVSHISSEYDSLFNDGCKVFDDLEAAIKEHIRKNLTSAV